MRSGRPKAIDELDLSDVCPKCGAVIPPARITRLDFNNNLCPECGEHYGAAQGVEARRKLQADKATASTL